MMTGRERIRQTDSMQQVESIVSLAPLQDLSKSEVLATDSHGCVQLLPQGFVVVILG